MNSKNQQKDNNKRDVINEGYKPSKKEIKHDNTDKKQNTNQKTTQPPAQP